MNYTKIVAGLVLVAALLGCGVYVNNLRDENRLLLKNNTELTVKLGLQNEAVLLLGREATKRVEAHKEEIANARAEAVKARASAAKTYAAKPSTPDDLCKSALDLVNGVE